MTSKQVSKMTYNRINGEDIEFVDEDGNVIVGGKENLVYVNRKGKIISEKRALKALESGAYVDGRSFYDDRLNPNGTNRDVKVQHYEQQQPYYKAHSQTNHGSNLVSDMYKIFEEARKGVKHQPDLNMIERDAMDTGYSHNQLESDIYRSISKRNLPPKAPQNFAYQHASSYHQTPSKNNINPKYVPSSSKTHVKTKQRSYSSKPVSLNSSRSQMPAAVNQSGKNLYAQAAPQYYVQKNQGPVHSSNSRKHLPVHSHNQAKESPERAMRELQKQMSQTSLRNRSLQPSSSHTNAHSRQMHPQQYQQQMQMQMQQQQQQQQMQYQQYQQQFMYNNMGYHY